MKMVQVRIPEEALIVLREEWPGLSDYALVQKCVLDVANVERALRGEAPLEITPRGRPSKQPAQLPSDEPDEFDDVFEGMIEDMKRERAESLPAHRKSESLSGVALLQPSLISDTLAARAAESEPVMQHMTLVNRVKRALKRITLRPPQK